MKIKKFFKKLPRILGERAFLTSLGLIIIALILGGVIFYKYSIFIQKFSSQTLMGGEKPSQFNEKNFQEILKIWQEKEKKFKEADSKEYPNPFR